MFSVALFEMCNKKCSIICEMLIIDIKSATLCARARVCWVGPLFEMLGGAGGNCLRTNMHIMTQIVNY